MQLKTIYEPFRIKAVEPIDPVYAEPAVEAPHEEMTEYIDGVTVIEKQEETAPTSEE